MLTFIKSLIRKLSQSFHLLIKSQSVALMTYEKTITSQTHLDKMIIHAFENKIQNTARFTNINGIIC